MVITELIQPNTPLSATCHIKIKLRETLLIIITTGHRSFEWWSSRLNTLSVSWCMFTNGSTSVARQAVIKNANKIDRQVQQKSGTVEPMVHQCMQDTHIVLLTTNSVHTTSAWLLRMHACVTAHLLVCLCAWTTGAIALVVRETSGAPVHARHT